MLSYLWTRTTKPRLQTEMNEEKTTSKDELMREFLREVIGKASLELGVVEAKQLVSGEEDENMQTY